jgi:predicted dehydrogenase
MTRKLRFALVGTGAFGAGLGKFIQADPLGTISCICDRNLDLARKAAQELGIDVPLISDYDAVLGRNDVDAVVLCTPNFTHAAQTISAAKAGKHIFCEKSMANSTVDCWSMVLAAKEAGVKLMVGHKRRLRTPWARMIELATNGKLGSVAAVNATAFHWDTYIREAPEWWRKKDKSGGLLQLNCPHVIDAFNALCAPNQEPAECVSAMYGPQQDEQFDYPDLMSVTIRYRSGALATMQSSLNYRLRRFRESSGPWIQLTQGAIELHPAMGHIELAYQHVNDAEPHREHFDDLGFDVAYSREIGDFIRWVQNGDKPCLTWREGLRTVEVMEAAYRSADAGGTPISLPLCPNQESHFYET